MNVTIASTFFISPEDEYAMATADLVTPFVPEVMPECWQADKPDAQKCVDAMRALCRGVS